MRRKFTVATLAIVAVLIAGRSQAQVGAPEAKCRSAIAKGTAKYVKSAQTLIAKCHKLRNAGNLPGTTDCNDLLEADPDAKLSAVADKLYEKVGGAKDVCSDTGGPLTDVLTQFGRCPAPDRDAVYAYLKQKWGTPDGL